MPQNQALVATNYFFNGQSGFYRGKVRDVYYIKEDIMVAIACDRISAFDHVLPRPIPFKGQVLNQIAAYFLQNTADICPNWYLDSPDPNVTVGRRCQPFPVEMVIRGYLAGHAWREYQAGLREICGVPLPDGLKENDRLPNPIITPTIKATKGHDEDISKENIIQQGLVPENRYLELEKFTHLLFQRGTEMAAKQGLILVDTKYEFGLFQDQVLLMDEVHTPDSSRYFMAHDYEQRQNTGQEQVQLSKEFVRQWLMANGFQGLEGQEIPAMTDEFIHEISQKYADLYSSVTGKTFISGDYTHIFDRVEENTKSWLQRNGLW